VQRKSILAITLSHASVDMQTGSLAVLLPVLLSSLHLNYAAAAAIITANNLVIAVAQPLFGVLGDHKSFKWMVWVGCLLTGVAMVSVLWQPFYALVIVAVMASGIGSAMFHPEGLSRVRAISGNRVASSTSLFFSGGNLGFALGPILATSLLERLGKAGSLLMLVPTLLAVLLLWSQWRSIAGGEGRARAASPASRRPWLAAAGLVAFLMLLITLRSTVTTGLQTFIPLYFHHTGSLGREAAAFLVTLLAISGAVGTLTGGILADRYGRKLIMASTALIGLAALHLFLHSTGLVQMAAVSLAGAALSAAWPIIVVMIQEAMPGNVGLASGLSLGTAYGASGLGVALLGNLADAFGLGSVMQLLTLLPLGIFAMTLFVPEREAKPMPT